MRKYVLDLSGIYSDHRRKAYLGHRPTWTTIRTLIQTLREIFGIKSHVHVCSAEEIFYPESESVEILRDGETLKILPESASNETVNIADWKEDCLKENAVNSQLDSTFEDIESALCNLAKPKRRRVRKRKAKKLTQDNPSHCLPQSESTAGENHIRLIFSNSDSEDKPPIKTKLPAEEELPYRNLNRQMKARVVRAVSLSTLSTPPSDEVPVSPPPKRNGADTTNETLQPHSGCAMQPKKKARVVRAISLENTVEIKRELIEACKSVLNADPLETVKQIKETESDQNVDEHEVSLINDMETYSTIVSDV